MSTLIVLRLFAGIGGSAVLSVGGGVISDTFPKEKMGGATAAFSIGPLIGPVVGPVIGGFVTQALGWRWVRLARLTSLTRVFLALGNIWGLHLHLSAIHDARNESPSPLASQNTQKN